MAKELLKRYFIVFCSLIMTLAFLVTLTPVALSAEKVIKWNVSLKGGRRARTEPLHNWVAEMDKKTHGHWKIKLHYGSVLAPAKEALDGIRAGLFQAAGMCVAYTPGKLPLHTVFELPFITPRSNTDMCRMMIELWKHPAIKKELLKWNAVPCIPASHCQYQLMGTRAIRKVEDFKGARIRVGGEIAKALKLFGAVPTLVPAPETYEALSRGTIDLVGMPYSYAYGSYKIYEVSKYVTLMSLGGMFCPIIASKDAWQALPEDYKKFHMDFYNRSPQSWSAAYKVADDKWIPIFEKKLEFIDFPTSERDKIVERTKPLYEKWVKAREKQGLPGKEVLSYFLKKRKELTGM